MGGWCVSIRATYLLSMPLSSFLEAARGCARGAGLRVLKGSWKAVVVAVVVCVYEKGRVSTIAGRGFGE